MNLIIKSPLFRDPREIVNILSDSRLPPHRKPIFPMDRVCANEVMGNKHSERVKIRAAERIEMAADLLTRVLWNLTRAADIHLHRHTEPSTHNGKCVYGNCKPIDRLNMPLESMNTRKQHTPYMSHAKFLSSLLED